jgi:hypothetical protein
VRRGSTDSSAGACSRARPCGGPSPEVEPALFLQRRGLAVEIVSRHCALRSGSVAVGEVAAGSDVADDVDGQRLGSLDRRDLAVRESTRHAGDELERRSEPEVR